MHSQYRDLGINLTKKTVLVWHTGSGYRQKFKKFNAFFNPMVDASICARDLFGLGAKNEKWVGGLVDTDLLSPVYSRDSNKVIIAHYPSNYKGADKIQAAVERLKDKDQFIFRYDDQRISWVKQMKRLSECDIYVENFYEVQKGRLTGAFGIAALEAAALGKIVVTRFLFMEDYEQRFGKCAIQVVHTVEELAKILAHLISLSDNELLKLKKQSREWVVRCHSYEAVAQRLLKVIEEL